MMDPDATLTEIRELIRAVWDNPYDADSTLELAHAVDDLDGWLSDHGFLPQAWDHER